MKCSCMIFISMQCINWISVFFLPLFFYLWGEIGVVRDRALDQIDLQSKSAHSCISSQLFTLKIKNQGLIFLHIPPTMSQDMVPKTPLIFEHSSFQTRTISMPEAGIMQILALEKKAKAKGKYYSGPFCQIK